MQKKKKKKRDFLHLLHFYTQMQFYASLEMMIKSKSDDTAMNYLNPVLKE